MNIKLDDLWYATKRRQRSGFSKYSLTIALLRDLYGGNLSLEDADRKQSELDKKFSGIKRGRIALEKRSLLKKVSIIS